MTDHRSPETKAHDGACICPACMPDLWTAGIKGVRAPEASLASNPRSLHFAEMLDRGEVFSDRERGELADLIRALEFENGEAETHIERLTRELADRNTEFRESARSYEFECRRLRAALELLTNGYKYPTEVCQIAREALSGSPNSAPERQLSTSEAVSISEAFARSPRRVSGETKDCSWQPIETAPKDGRTLLLGYYNSAGKWRTMRGQWFTEGSMDEWDGDEPDNNPAGWYETCVENDDPPNCWATEPTHWAPLLSPPPAEKAGEKS